MVQETRVPWAREQKERKTPRRRVYPGLVLVSVVVVVSSSSPLSSSFPPLWSSPLLWSSPPSLRCRRSLSLFVPLSRRRRSTRNPPHKQLLVRLGTGVCFGVGSSPCVVVVPRRCWFVVVGSLLSTCDPPCEQGLATVVAGAGRLRCHVVIIVIVF